MMDPNFQIVSMFIKTETFRSFAKKMWKLLDQNLAFLRNEKYTLKNIPWKVS